MFHVKGFGAVKKDLHEVTFTGEWIKGKSIVS